MKRIALASSFFAALTLAACSGSGGGSGPSNDNQFIRDVANALGGVSAVQGTKTLVFESVLEGDGESYWLGENRSPDADLPVFRTLFRWAYNWDGAQFRKQELKVAQFVSSNDQIRAYTYGLDGEVAYDVGIDLKVVKLPDEALKQRRAELRMHPIGAIRAALDPDAKVGAVTDSGGSKSADVTLKDGTVLTIKVDGTTKLPQSVSAKINHPILGDVVHEIEFSDYSKNGNVMLPANFVIKLDNKPIGRFRATQQVLNFDPTAPVPDSVQVFSGESASAGNRFQGFDKGVRLQVPPILAKQPAQPRALYMADEDIPSMPVTEEVAAPGVWYLKGGDYFSVLVELADHLTLIEAPVDEARFNAIVAKAAQLAPNKKITELVITHHHFDHLGGVRAAIAAGLTLYVRGDVQGSSANPEQGRAAPILKPIKSFYEDIASRPHTIVPDALQKAPKTPVITEVGDKLVLGDKTRSIELYPIVDSEYADTLLMAFLPKEKLLVEADVFTPPADIYNTLMLYPFVQNLIDNVNADKLKVDKILPLHGHIVPYDEMIKALQVRRQDPSAGNGATPQ